jgi:hypothetical protein
MATPRQASKAIKAACVLYQIPFSSVKAQTVSFSDLARGSAVFVTVYGWQKDEMLARGMYQVLQGIAKMNGFHVDVSTEVR